MATITVNDRTFPPTCWAPTSPCWSILGRLVRPLQDDRPALEEISEELADKVTIAKVDIMANTATATEFGVQSIPFLVLFKDGKPVAQKLGAAPKGALKGWIESVL
jgi:thioredoxin 1